ncbi:MAG TPA: flavodoxin domain-containing protein [Actinomycetes bacterium]|nr:flavodoxin domain-containing protein [Actinomycetes bacterium]
MRAVVVYESMYGNTRAVAEAIAEGLSPRMEAEAVPVSMVRSEAVAAADLVVVGGPTHVHGMSRPSTRKSAVEAAAKPGAEVHLDEHAEGEGLREWFDRLPHQAGMAAAFDTRIDLSAAMTGRASKGIGKRLRQHGMTLLSPPESFLVDKAGHLEAQEQQRARDWGVALAAALMPATG